MAFQSLPPLILPPNAPGTPLEGPVGPQGPAGPPGDTGPAGPPGSGGGSNIFIYRDSEPSPSGNVFATWAGAYAAAIAVNGPATITMDDTLNQCSIPLNAGDFDLHQITLAGQGGQFTTVFVIFDGVTFNEGVFRVTDGLVIFTEFSNPTYLITPLKSQTLTIDNFSVFGVDGVGGIFDFSAGPGDLTLNLNNIGGAIDDGAGNPFIQFGTGDSNCEIIMGDGAFIGSGFADGTSGSVNIDVYSSSVDIPISFLVSDSIIDVDINWNEQSYQVEPFRGNALPSVPDFSKNINIGTMFYHTTDGKPLWWDGSAWNDAGIAAGAYKPSYFHYTMSGPQTTHLTTGEHLDLNNLLVGWTPNGSPPYIGFTSAVYPSSGQVVLTFSPTSNVGFKLTGSLGALFDGNIAIQWWDTTNNVGIGNVTGNVGNGIAGEAIAILPPSYATTQILVELRLVFVSGTTFIGENTAGGFILPWAIVETIGAPQ
jgi:hypothetical protein